MPGHTKPGHTKPGHTRPGQTSPGHRPDRRIVSTGETAKDQTQPWLRAATRATYVAFIGAGFAFASWAARIPQVRDRLHLSSADVGLVLLSLAAGSIVALLLAGIIVSRFH